MFPLIKSGRGVLTPVPGERTSLKLVNGVATNTVTVIARARVVVSVAAATALRNRGSVFALFDEIGLDENGTDKQVMKGNVLRFASEMSAYSALSATRAQLPVGTYMLEEHAQIQCADPYAALPYETAFRERNISNDISVFARLNAGFANGSLLYNAGPATVAVDQVSITVLQNYERNNNAPLYVPMVRQVITPIAGSVTASPIYLRGTNNVRKMVISQEAGTVGEVGDIISRLALRGDFTDIIGPATIDIDDLILDSEFSMGGMVVTSNRSHLGLNFQQYGQLARTLNPQQDGNLRLEVDAAPTAAAGAGTSQIRTTLFELVRDPNVVSQTLPFTA